MCTDPRNRLSARGTLVAIILLATLSGCTAAGGGGGASVSVAERPSQSDEAFSSWRVYGGDDGSTRYSSLDQINRQNVSRLEVAWIHHTGDMREGDWSQVQANPIVVDSVLYGVSPGLRAIALHAGNGRSIWSFDPWPDHPDDREDQKIHRGLAYWEEGEDRRVFYSAGRRLYALDARTGRPISSFGTEGWIDLREGLDADVGDLWVLATSPGIVYQDLLVQGTRVSEGSNAAPGHIRAFDVRTGARRWIFHTIPRPGEIGYETWPPDAWQTVGGVNSWPGMALDAERGIVYVPTGSAAFDYYGGNRHGENLFANSLLALDASTGQRIWHFQTVHHDIFDRDLPASPNLLTVVHDGRRVDAVAQVTKSAMVFLFDRETGAPLFEVEERPVPPSTLKGEDAWPTQPFPVKPPPFARQDFTEDQVTDISPASREEALRRYRQARADGPYNPTSVEGSVFFPGLDGGAEWGGAAVDPHGGILYVNANEMPWILRMEEDRSLVSAAGTVSGERVYGTYCAGCHGANRSGGGDRYPSLLGLARRQEPSDVLQVLNEGRGFMPSFETLAPEEKQAVIGYVLGIDSAEVQVSVDEPWPAHTVRLPYRLVEVTRFLDSEGYPAIKPPWGTLNAIDLNRGEILWQAPLGEFEALTARGIPLTGTENYGGPILTAGGLVFIGATRDERFRAFDAATGEVLWQYDLPAGGYATPATYLYGGRQYVVIPAAGGKMGTKKGDAYVAFALPED